MRYLHQTEEALDQASLQGISEILFYGNHVINVNFHVIAAHRSIYSLLLWLGPTLPGSQTVSALTRRLKPAGCGCCVGNSRWGCFPAWRLPGCNYQSSRAWRTTRRPLGSCGKPPRSLQHSRGHSFNAHDTHGKAEGLAAKKRRISGYSLKQILQLFDYYCNAKQVNYSKPVNTSKSVL